MWYFICLFFDFVPFFHCGSCCCCCCWRNTKLKAHNMCRFDIFNQKMMTLIFFFIPVWLFSISNSGFGYELYRNKSIKSVFFASPNICHTIISRLICLEKCVFNNRMGIYVKAIRAVNRSAEQMTKKKIVRQSRQHKDVRERKTDRQLTPMLLL